MTEIGEYLPDNLFAGKTVFVTGGGSGINLGVARSFAALGAGVAICGRTAERLEVARAELESLGAPVATAVADVRDYDALVVAFDKSRAELGPIHTLVCGAAGNFLAPAEKLSANGFKTVVDIDLIGSFNAARGAFEQLRETRGNLIFISAGQAFVPHVAQAHCGAAKAGVDNLMQNLALEWGRHGIRSNSIVPGPIEGTEGMRRLGPRASEAHVALKQAIPLGRYGKPAEIGQTAVFLASPLAAYITGTRVVVDGGMSLPGSGVFSQLVLSAVAKTDPTDHP
jgi:NAD(P)-dependent dehydrogenase (short-subunit alcohol dehydrogenase family)